MAGDERLFGELFAEPPRNGLTRPRAVRGVGVKMVNMGELFAHPRLRNSPMDRVPLSDGEAERFLLLEGDLLFARQSLVLEGAGKCSIFLEDGEPVTFESHVTRVRLDRDKADPRFYFYYLQSPHGRAAVRSIVEQGAGASGIRGSDLRTLGVQWRPIPEQRAIAHILGTLDDKIEANRRMNETLEAMARALFKSWFVDFDPVRAKAEGRDTGLPRHLADLFPDCFEDSAHGEIPGAWTMRRLGDVVSYLSRGVSPKYVDSGGVLVLNQKCIRDGQIDLSRARRHDVGARPVAGRQLRVGDVLINSTGVGTLGRVGQLFIAEEATIVDSHVSVVRADDRYVSWNYLGLELSRREDEIEELGEGSTGQTELSRRRLADLPIAVHGRELITAFDDLTVPLRLRSSCNAQESRTVSALRDALLPRLISGELRVKDAERFVAGIPKQSVPAPVPSLT